MKKGIKAILAVLLVLIIGAGSFVLYKNTQGISYDLSSVEKMQNSVEIIAEDADSVTIRKNGDGDFKVLMFTDTHLNGKKQTDNMTVSYIVKNITAQQPDLVVFGGDNVSSGFNKKRNEEFAQLMENLGVYWAAVLGNHEGDGLMAVSREENVQIFSSYEYCLMRNGKDDVDGNGNYTINILNADNTLKEVFFFMDSGSYMTEESKTEYGVTQDGEVYDGVKISQVNWYNEKHASLTAQYGDFKSVLVVHIPPYQAEQDYAENDFLYGAKREGVCESGFDAGLVDAMIEKGSAQAVYFGHDHVNDFGVMYENILLSYIQPSGYGVYNMQSKFGSPENEWIQGCTLLTIAADGTYTAEQIFNHQ
ncbi:MAG: metallophosphoesterase [Clostridia bacterium]|nr:metallophosphoesterase [Clostridia bacterium]